MYLITRADWDGLVCAVLLTSVESLAAIELTHPKDMQDGKVDVREDAIIANLPYHPKCALWFDHHRSEEEMAQAMEAAKGYKGRFAIAPSAARLVFEYYAERGELRRFADLVVATDRYDSATLSLEDVLNPQGYIRLAYTVDPRTSLVGLNWREYFFHLLGLLKEYAEADVLEDETVKKALAQVAQEDELFKTALTATSRVQGNMVVTDFRGLEKVPTGNRFLVHALYPETNIAARIYDAKGGKTTLSLGHSLFKRDCQTNIGELLAEYGGGGHRGAGTVQFFVSEAGPKIDEILERVAKNG